MPIHPTKARTAKRLSRLATLLSALADLAERAAGRSGAVCWLVLWLIRPAEAVARDYVEKIAPAATEMPPLGPLDAAAEALRLAGSFRLLAATLEALAQQCLARLPAAPADRPSVGGAAPSPALVGPWPVRQPCPP